jgi:DNA polymerase I-like protein with 3'-5' exonuclease and polymerase domains
MLKRPAFPKHKPVVVVNDIPVKREILSGDKFSEPSNLSLLTSLRTGKVSAKSSATPTQGCYPINSLDIHTTYVDMTYWGDIDHNTDWCQELSAKPVEGWILHEHTRVWCSPRLHAQITALVAEIEAVKPLMVIVTGKWGLFWLSGLVRLSETANSGAKQKPLGALAKYRASILWLAGNPSILLYPMYHTVNVHGMPQAATIIEFDLRRAGDILHNLQKRGPSFYKKPPVDVVLGTTLPVVRDFIKREILPALDTAPTLVSVDIETMFHSVIDCIGLAITPTRGICVPFAHLGNPVYWTPEAEIEVWDLIRSVLLHKNCRAFGQNFTYDTAYLDKLYLLPVRIAHDTMVMHHALYNTMPKDLAFLASRYCQHYTYWKDEITATAVSPESRWTYNVKDILYTYEVLKELQDILEDAAGPKEVYDFTVNSLLPEVVKTMNRGVSVDVRRKEDLRDFFSKLADSIFADIQSTLGFEINLNSVAQKKKLFVDFFGMTLQVKKRKDGSMAETTDAKAMLEYMETYPMFRPFLALILEYVAITKFTNTFLGMGVDGDNRVRTQYRVSGTATGRLASTKSLFGSGANLQNIPTGGKIDLQYAVELVEDHNAIEDIVTYTQEGAIALPNIKSIFLCDPGYEIMDCDLGGADAQIVAAESECKWLIEFFANPKGKLYAYIASQHLQREITSDSPEYKIYKSVCHGTNYKLGIDKLSKMLGISLDNAKALQAFYFSLCPEIPKWHAHLATTIARRGYLENKFGRRGWFLDKNDPNLLNKACAFLPQSTVADVINRAWIRIASTLPDIQVLMQVHDSLVLQYPLQKAAEYRRIIPELMRIPIPYKPVLVIPSDSKISDTSYGEMRKNK